MAFMATVSIIMFLTFTYPGLAASLDENGSHLKVMSDREYAKMLERFNGMNCPPLGFTDRYNVTVVGTEWSRTGGCSYIQRYPSVSPSQLFHLWLRRSQNGGVGHCGDLQNMDHFMFECLSKNNLITDDEFAKGWQYISLYQHTLFEYYERSKNESTRPAYRCALYKTQDDNPDVILMAISENMNADQHNIKCDGLLERLEYGPYVHGGQKQFYDGSMLLILNREETELPQRKRSALQGGGCRFPDWSQGLWSNLQVDGNVLHGEDSVDDTPENGSGSATADSHYPDVRTNASLNYNKTPQKSIECATRTCPQQNRQQRENTKFKWRCVMSVDNDERRLQRHEAAAKFLTYGGRVVEKDVLNDKNKEQESARFIDITEDTTMSYGCLWLESRGRNIFYSIIGTGMPDKNQDFQSFAQQLCKEKKAFGRDAT